ncbi:MAG TPA: hypothetical protein VE568_02040 [Rubrobacter sp.]|nr:hypothetical protein [Rubrobacter sp.]
MVRERFAQHGRGFLKRLITLLDVLPGFVLVPLKLQAHARQLYDPPEVPNHAGRLGRVNSPAGNRQSDEYFCGPFHAP